MSACASCPIRRWSRRPWKRSKAVRASNARCGRAGRRNTKPRSIPATLLRSPKWCAISIVRRPGLEPGPTLVCDDEGGCGRPSVLALRRQCDRIYLALRELGQQGIEAPLFFETEVQHLLLVAQIQLAGERRRSAVGGNL